MKTVPKIIATIIAGLLLLGTIWLIEAQGKTGYLLLTTTADQAEVSDLEDVQATVESVSLYQDTDGWEIVSRPNKTISLIQSQPASDKLLDRLSVPVGTYKQIRLRLSEVTAIDQDSNKTSPSVAVTEVIFPSISSIEHNSTSSIAFSFRTTESLRKTAEDNYQFLPHIELEAYANINKNDLSSSDSATASNGLLTSHTVVRTTPKGNYVRSSQALRKNNEPSSTSTSSIDRNRTNTSTPDVSE